jgi:ribosome-associated protein
MHTPDPRRSPDRPHAPPPTPPGGVELAPGVTAPHDALRLQYARGSGPGGQNVNKVNTKAELWLDLSRVRGLTPNALARLRTLAGSRLTVDGHLHLSSDESRSQEGNRTEILRRLRDMIVEAKPEPKRRRKTKPTRGSKLRRLEAKRRTSEIKSRRRGDA